MVLEHVQSNGVVVYGLSITIRFLKLNMEVLMVRDPVYATVLTFGLLKDNVRKIDILGNIITRWM